MTDFIYGLRHLYTLIGLLLLNFVLYIISQPKISCHLMCFNRPIFCSSFLNLMSFVGPKNLILLMDPGSHVLWWTHFLFPLLKPHVFWWTQNLMSFDGPFPSWNLMSFDGPQKLLSHCFTPPKTSCLLMEPSGPSKNISAKKTNRFFWLASGSVSFFLLLT